jgi:YD repeat-containing protein
MKNNFIRIVPPLALIAFIVISQNSYAVTTHHTYDFLNRLVQTVITDGSKTTTITYQYDTSGNMTRFITQSDTSITIQNFAANFGRSNCGSGCDGNFDGDVDVDGKDLAHFLGM